jgi:hypothetical protein
MLVRPNIIDEIFYMDKNSTTLKEVVVWTDFFSKLRKAGENLIKFQTNFNTFFY